MEVQCPLINGRTREGGSFHAYHFQSMCTCAHSGFWLSAGPLKILTVTLQWTNQKFLKTFLEPAPGGIVFFDFLKAKNEEKLNFLM